MSKMKKSDEKNSLEQLLLKGKSAYEGNKSKALQYVLLIVLAVAVVVLIRSKFFGGPSGKMDVADQAYYSAAQDAFSGTGTGGSALVEVANSYKGDANAGDVFLNEGQGDVEGKRAASRGTKSDAASGEPDPVAKFSSAYEAYEKASASNDADVKARAFYGMGVAQEYLASVASDDEAVVAAIEKAKEAYKKVAEATEGNDSPYRATAANALANLERDLTAAYYKSAAKNFRELPEPSDEPVLSEKGDELNVGEAVNVEGFDTNDDGDSAEAPASEGEGEAASEPAAEETPAPASESEPAAETPAE